jgi:hypothetical protein
MTGVRDYSIADLNNVLGLDSSGNDRHCRQVPFRRPSVRIAKPGIHAEVTAWRVPSSVAI